jgi:hypothetical protein
VVHHSNLPCGGCPKCLKVHQAWNTFVDKIDDVAELTPPGSWSYSPLEEETTSTEPDIRLAEPSSEPPELTQGL